MAGGVLQEPHSELSGNNDHIYTANSLSRSIHRTQLQDGVYHRQCSPTVSYRNLFDERFVNHIVAELCLIHVTPFSLSLSSCMYVCVLVDYRNNETKTG